MLWLRGPTDHDADGKKPAEGPHGAKQGDIAGWGRVRGPKGPATGSVTQALPKALKLVAIL
jgi:hypothetical protein